jgi:hypothetical protein
MTWYNFKTLVDYIYITNLEKLQESHVVQYSVSDHYPVCMTGSEQISVKKEIVLFSSNSNLSIHSTSSLGFL